MKMKEIKRLGSTKRFGARYGRRTKERFAEIEKELKKKHKCPYCSSLAVKRLAVGIWYCKKCNARFTGKAYTLKEKGMEEKEVA